MSVVANVAINVDARSAVGQLKAVQSQAAQAEQAVTGVGTSAARSMPQAATAANGLTASLMRVAGAYLSLRTAQAALQAGIQREESIRRLTFLAKGYGEVAQAQERAANAGAKFGLSATESNQQFAQLYGRLRPLNVSLSDIEAAFVGFNTAAKVSGTTTAESAGALLQLSQALGSGVLRGQELNSVLEQAPGLVVALTQELGAPINQIRKLAEEGKITSDVVIRALKRAGTEGADELAAAMNGPAQAVKNLQNEFENFQVAATKDILPSVIDGVRILTKTIAAIGPVISNIGKVAGPVLNYINSLIEKATGIEQARFKAQMTQKVGASRLERAGVGRTYKDAQGNTYSTITGRMVAAAPRIGQQVGAIPPLLGGGGGGGRAGGGAGKSEAEKLAEELQKSLAAGVQLGVEFNRQIKLANAVNQYEEERLKIQYQYRDRLKQIGDLKNAEQRDQLKVLAATLRDAELQKLKKKELEDQKEAIDAIIKKMDEMQGVDWSMFGGKNVMSFTGWGAAMEETQRQLDELTNPINQVVAGAAAIGSAFAESFRGIVSGSMTAQEALASFFRSTANHFLDMAAQIASAAITNSIVQFIGKAATAGLGSIGGGGGFGGGGIDWGQTPSVGGVPDLPGLGLASGGFVTGPTSAMIGEGGQPEYIIPAGKMRESMRRYSAGARGSAVIPAGNDTSASTEGGVAVATPIDVRYTVERINSVDYVTADQFQAGMRQAATQGAQRGEQATLRRLQGSPTTRRKLGL